MFELGKTYRTRGGWPAKVIWICPKEYEYSLKERYLYVIHKPGTLQESLAISHFPNGIAYSSFSANEPPRYDSLHPADLTEEEIK